eukprot:1133671-Pelagomonas_calceolata.AAC.9
METEEEVCCQLSTALTFLAKGAKHSLDRETFVRLAQQAAAKYLKPANETHEHAVPVPVNRPADQPAGEAPANFLHVRTAERQQQHQPTSQVDAPVQDAAPGVPLMWGNRSWFPAFVHPPSEPLRSESLPAHLRDANKLSN